MIHQLRLQVRAPWTLRGGAGRLRAPHRLPRGGARARRRGGRAERPRRRRPRRRAGLGRPARRHHGAASFPTPAPIDRLLSGGPGGGPLFRPIRPADTAPSRRRGLSRCAVP